MHLHEELHLEAETGRWEGSREAANAILLAAMTCCRSVTVVILARVAIFIGGSMAIIMVFGGPSAPLSQPKANCGECSV